MKVLRYVFALSKYYHTEQHYIVKYVYTFVENLDANRRNRFINRYGKTDDYLCQLFC